MTEENEVKEKSNQEVFEELQADRFKQATEEYFKTKYPLSKIFSNPSKNNPALIYVMLAVQNIEKMMAELMEERNEKG